MEAIKDIREKTEQILEKHGIARAAVFGSYARGEYKKNSDIDILIEYFPEARKTYFDIIDLKNELEEVLEKKVDLVTKGAIPSLIKEDVLKEMQVIL